MSKYYDRAVELRMDPNVHYNCAQAVVIPFAEEKGFTVDMLMKIADNFGAGMRTGNVCGAVTGALMALGVCGAGEPSDAQTLLKMVKENHGTLLCGELLKISHDKGKVKKAHCDGMVYECVNAVEKILTDKGLL